MQFFSVIGMVYLLCAATSLACAILLGRGYSRNRVPLLFWSCLCFVGLAIDNALLYVDRIVMPQVDFGDVRRFPALIALMLLIYGLVFEGDARQRE